MGCSPRWSDVFARGVKKKRIRPIPHQRSSQVAAFGFESIRSHAGSAGHKRAEDCIRIAANPQEVAIPRALRHLKEAVSKLKKLFDVAYFVAKLEMPFTTYPQLCQLEQKHGI